MVYKKIISPHPVNTKYKIIPRLITITLVTAGLISVGTLSAFAGSNHQENKKRMQIRKELKVQTGNSNQLNGNSTSRASVTNSNTVTIHQGGGGVRYIPSRNNGNNGNNHNNIDKKVVKKKVVRHDISVHNTTYNKVTYYPSPTPIHQPVYTYCSNYTCSQFPNGQIVIVNTNTNSNTNINENDNSSTNESHNSYYDNYYYYWH